MKDNLEEERKRLNCFDEIQTVQEGYEDGIINLECYRKQKIKILWILKETDGKFSIVDSFNKDNAFKKGVWKTWKNVARISSVILDEKECSDSQNELTDIMKRIAVINLKKKPGKASTDMKTFSAVFKSDEKARNIVEKQIRNIKPDVVICGNVLQLLSSIVDFRNGAEKRAVEHMNKKNMYAFDNIVFINAYHPCYPNRSGGKITNDTYCSSVIDCYKNWQEIKKDKTLAVFEDSRFRG